MTRVIDAGPDDLDTLSQVIAAAFIDLPPSAWLISDPVVRRRIFPAYTPYHHLAMLAVQPGLQGQGTGSALLASYHRALDRHGRHAAYLEASTPRSRDLYLRHGYVPRENGPFSLPDGGPPMWPMLRPPQRRAS